MTLSEYLSSILHVGSQGMQAPTMAVVLLLILAMIFTLGFLLIEYLTERRHFKVNHRAVIARIHDADYNDVAQVIKSSNLLRNQAAALLCVARNMGLPDEELFAVAQLELEKADTHYRRRINFTDTISKIAPMLGLMGTLIPLGPGIVAMGDGDVSTLSSSLLIAFDTTVCGLVCAIVAVVISRIRRTWYGQYATMLQSLMSCVMEEAARAHEEGVELPYGYAADPEIELRRLHRERVEAAKPSVPATEPTRTRKADATPPVPEGYVASKKPAADVAEHAKDGAPTPPVSYGATKESAHETA
jgi:biopolymer transport protein ExbB/TolQ